MQRAGRAGRTAPGRVLRLYAQADYLLRPDHDLPEILRDDLAGLALVLRSMGLSLRDYEQRESLAWLQPPPAAAVDHAEELLDRLDATGDLAVQMARLPLPPRLSRMLLAAAERGAGDAACVAAALLSTGSGAQRADLLEAIDAQEGYTAGAQPDPRVKQTTQQLRRLIRTPQQGASNKSSDDALLLATLAGFPDRVARRRAGKEVLLANGVTAELAGQPPPYEFMVVLDAEDRREKPLPLVRMTSRIEPDWLIGLFPDRVREVNTLTWNRHAGRVEATARLLYDDLLLQEWRDATPDAAAAATLLADKAMESGLAAFVDQAALENLAARAAFCRAPGTRRPTAALRELCLGLDTFSFAALKLSAEALLPLMEAKLDAQGLRELAPGTLKLKHGRPMQVHYEAGKPPWIASRMQDFFGMQDGPRIGPQHTPVVMHLLGPNQRAVQTTTDLRGFWQRLYPEVRRGPDAPLSQTQLAGKARMI